MDDEPPLQAPPAAARPAEPVSRVQASPAVSRPAYAAQDDVAAASTHHTAAQRPTLASKSGHPVGLFSRTIISKAEAAQAAIAGLRTAAPRRDAPSTSGDPTHQRGQPHAIGRAASFHAPVQQHELGGHFRQPSPALSWEGVSRSAASDGRLPRPFAPTQSPFVLSPPPTPRYNSAPAAPWNYEDRSSAHARFSLNHQAPIAHSYPLGEELDYEANTLEEISALLASDLRRGPLLAPPPAAMEDGGLQLGHAWSRPPVAVETHELQLSDHVPLRLQRFTEADGLRHYVRPFGLGCSTDEDYDDDDEDGGLKYISAGRPEVHLPLRFPTVY